MIGIISEACHGAIVNLLFIKSKKEMLSPVGYLL